MKFNNSFKILIILFIFTISFSGRISAQIDSAAVAILDQMNYAVGSLRSASFTIETDNDIADGKLGLVTHTDISKVFLKAPDKLYVSNSGDKGNKEFFYNGNTFTYYSKDNNQYSSADAPPTIMQAINSIHDSYGIEFPGADFFYPYFVDDVLEISNNLSYLGVASMDNRKSYHVAGTTNDFTYQIWIADDGSFLPVKMTIVYIDKATNPQYSATYSNWSLNPTLENSIFDFSAPSNSLKVKFAEKK